MNILAKISEKIKGFTKEHPNVMGVSTVVVLIVIISTAVLHLLMPLLVAFAIGVLLGAVAVPIIHKIFKSKGDVGNLVSGGISW